MPKIFISHTHSDKEIADAINEAIEHLFGTDVVEVVYSTKKEEGGIAHGEDWFDWIVKQVSQADVALILLTPGSIQKPWILWEAGAVEGVALASIAGGDHSGPRPRKVRPMTFRLRSGDIPSPFHRLQAISGDQHDDVDAFLMDLISQFTETLDNRQILSAGRRMEETVATYLERVSAAMLRAPLLVTEAAVQEWLERLDRYQKRSSEVEQLHDWLKVAFGRGDEDGDRPLDLRIHRRLGELYSKSDNLESKRRAVREMELARQLAPRDIFIQRQLGNAYINLEEYDKAREVIEEIGKLDSRAFERSAECAALKGKLLRRQKDPREAAKVFAAALRENPDSYYLANLAAEASLESQDKEEAIRFYRRSLEIIQTVDESNIWIWASAMNAGFATSDFADAEKYAKRIAGEKPSRDQLATIRGGLELVAKGLELPREALDKVVAVLEWDDPR